MSLTNPYDPQIYRLNWIFYISVQVDHFDAFGADLMPMVLGGQRDSIY